MHKKINLIIVGFFSVLTVLLDVGFMLYLPIVFYYLLKDYKNIYYLVPSGLIGLLLFTGTSYLISFGILVILLLFVLWIMNKLTKGYYMYIILGLLNLITYIIIYQGFPDFAKYLILLAVSLLLYIYFEKNLFEALKLNSVLYNQTISEILIILITILGGLKITVGINLGFLLAVFFAMYAASSWKNIYSLIYALIVLIIGVLFFDIQEMLFIPFIVSFYFLPFVYPILIVNVFSLLVILLNTGYKDELMLTIMGISLLFELLRNLIVTSYQNDNIIREGIYTQIVENVSKEVLSFAEMLNKFVRNFKNSKEYTNKMSESLKMIIQRNCNACPKRKECFSKNRNVIYPHFKSLILQKDLYSGELRDFLNECYHAKGVCSTAKNLNYRIDFSDVSPSNNALVAQLTGVSNAIRKYAVDMISKEEISYEMIANLKQKLLNYGYEITYFEVKRSFLKDFLIVIGIKNFNIKTETIELKELIDKILKVPVSIVQESIADNISFIQIIPELKVDIIYGYGSLSSEGNHICGDNYLIKNLNNGKFVTAISDGMGKGFDAFQESNNMLNIINDVVELNLDSTTSLEILNTFYALQEYLEKYATLDLVEINRYTKEAKFYKMGATTTYIIKKSGKIERITNQNLPFGIDENIENYQYYLEDDDLILMSSDGVFENIIEDKSLEQFILKIKNEVPQKIVYEILNYTLKQKLKTKDDMTLIALRIKNA